MATNTVDFSTWNFTNVQLAPAKLKLVDVASGVVITGLITAETVARIGADAAEVVARVAAVAAESAARVAADNAEAITRAAVDTNLQGQINALSESFAHSMLLGGM